MDLKPVFIQPPTIVKTIDPRDQREFDDCGTCPDCLYMLSLGLVERA